MAWLIQKSAALIAAYSIALQALVWGFVPPGDFGFDPFTIVCTTHNSGEHQPSPAQHRSNCDACLAVCSSSPALVPASAVFLLFFFGDEPKHPAVLAEPLTLQPRHQPQESRAPPISS
jgi:hypothetical protein